MGMVFSCRVCRCASTRWRFVSSVSHEWLLNFVGCYFCIYSHDHVTFLLWSLKVVSSITSRCNLSAGHAQVLSVAVCGIYQVPVWPASTRPPVPLPSSACSPPSSVTVCFDGQSTGNLETFRLAFMHCWYIWVTLGPSFLASTKCLRFILCIPWCSPDFISARVLGLFGKE